MRPRVVISQQNDWDARHYTFERNSRLPRYTFDTDRMGDIVAIVIAGAGLLLALLLGWGGS